MSLAQNEQKFLQLLRAALRNQKVEPADVTDVADWDGLFSMAAEHKLLPMTVSALPGEILAGIPRAKQTAIRQVVLQTVQSKAFITLYNGLRSAGFHPLVVKGIVCRSIYPQGDERPSGDEDLYVPDEEFDGCCEFLRDYGMEPTADAAPDAHEIGWQKRGGSLYIELHRRLFSPDSIAYGDLEAFFDCAAEKAAAYPTQYGTVYSLPPHDHLLYLLLHAYKHFLHSGFGIRQVCDIGLWAQRYHTQIDWERLTQQLRSCGAQQYAAAVLGIAAHELQIHMELPADWQTTREFCEPLLEDVLTSGVYGNSDSERLHSSTVTLNAVAADRTGKRSSIWDSVFLKRVDMENKYPYLRRFPFLLPVAWIQRIVHYLTKKRNARSRISSSITIGNDLVKLLKLYGIIK